MQSPLALRVFAHHSPCVKLAHLADPHLGIRQYHRQTPAGINQREADVANAFRAAIDDVIASRPDVVLIAGDLFHAVRPSNAAIVFAFRQFQRLREALPSVPVILIAGNHDTPRSTETGNILRLFEDIGVLVASEEAKRFRFPEHTPREPGTRLAVVFDPADHERMILDPDSWQGSKPRRS